MEIGALFDLSIWSKNHFHSTNAGARMPELSQRALELSCQPSCQSMPKKNERLLPTSPYHLDFFDDIYVPAHLMPNPSHSEPDPENKKVVRWIWEFDGENYPIDGVDEIRFRVQSVSYPSVPIDQERESKPFAPMVITVSYLLYLHPCLSYSSSISFEFCKIFGEDAELLEFIFMLRLMPMAWVPFHGGYRIIGSSLFESRFGPLKLKLRMVDVG
ncbi:hypothetical protein LguiA_020461 [Lonicera macranthoides]